MYSIKMYHKKQQRDYVLWYTFEWFLKQWCTVPYYWGPMVYFVMYVCMNQCAIDTA